MNVNKRKSESVFTNNTKKRKIDSDVKLPSNETLRTDSEKERKMAINIAKKNFRRSKSQSKNDAMDSNASILSATKKTKVVVAPSKEKLLGKNERKRLMKITKAKEDKHLIKDIYAELEKFNQLRPAEAVSSLMADVKKDKMDRSRNSLVEKIKPVSKRKYKKWQKQKNAHILKVTKSSPDTSDFSSDDDEEDEKIEELEVIKENIQKQEPASIVPLEAVKTAIPPKQKVGKSPVVSSAPKTFVVVNRPPEVQEARLQLPILAEEAAIMEAIEDNDVVIVSGDTGCGKTTQVPQFLYEAGFTKDGYKIAVTEPRQIAAISVSQRVKHELACNPYSSTVAYQVRHQNTATCGTQIKFMTDGILLQELNSDVLLRTYSAIIIDEAHERSVDTDVLIGIISKTVDARRRQYDLSIAKPTPNKEGRPPRPLKLIIMSATLRVADFAENERLFPGERRPPVIKLEGRQFPVQVSFSRHTRPNFLEEAFKAVCKVHNESVEGGVLVFVTGKQDCLTLCNWLKKAFPDTATFRAAAPPTPTSTNQSIKAANKAPKEEQELIKVNLTDFSIIPMGEEAEIDQDISEDDDDEDPTGGEEATIFNKLINGLYSNPNCTNPIYPLPLFSKLDKEKQDLVFKAPPIGQRMVVVATNVAETSLTIPGIKFVIDTGLVKVKRWDKVSGVSTFQLERICKSSAEQRKGRAGRTAPGQCIRLYSSAVYEDMRDFDVPEIMQRPVEDVVLMIKNYIPSSVPIKKFSLPTMPSNEALDRAERFLLNIEALQKVPDKKDQTKVTKLGKSMNKIPLSPRFARMLLFNQHDILPYVVLIASLLNVQDFFTSQTLTDFKLDAVKKRPDLMLGDITVLLASFCKLENFTVSSEDEGRLVAEKYGIRWKAFQEVKDLRQQLTKILCDNVKDLDLKISVLERPKAQYNLLRQLVLVGSSDQVAVLSPRAPAADCTPAERKRARYAYSSCSSDKAVFVHSQSVLYREKATWVVYQDLFESAVHGDSVPCMRNVTVIDPHWLPLFCPLACRPEGLLLDLAGDKTQLPYYDDEHDRVMACAKKVFYGQRGLLLPETVRVPVLPETMEDVPLQTDLLCRWFSRFLLEGLVVKEMAKWTKRMRPDCKPELLLLKYASGRPEVVAVVKEVARMRTPSRRALLDQWKKDPNYLLEAYLQWVLPDEREAVRVVWPPSVYL